MSVPQHDIRCPQCGAAGEFGYRDDAGATRWYCEGHRLRQHSSDARKPLPVESGEVVKAESPAVPQRSLEDLTRQLSAMIDEGRRLVRKRQGLDEKIEDLQLRCGQKLLEMRRRVEAGEQGDLAAVDWWGWFADAVPHVDRKVAERWLRIAADDDPEAAALAYRARDAEYQRAYRERKKLAAPSLDLTRESEIQAQAAPLGSDAAMSDPRPSKATPRSTLRSVPKRAPLFVGHDVDESAEIEQALAIFRRLTWNGRNLLTKRIAKFYDDWRRGVDEPQEQKKTSPHPTISPLMMPEDQNVDL